MRNVVFYGRVSTEHEAQLDALENQMKWYDDILEKNNDWKLVRKYIDRGITGTLAKKRPAFMEMMEDAKKGQFDLVVTREVCRFARNTVDTLNYTRKLKEKEVEVWFVEDNIRTMDGDGELRLSIMATLAQEESRKISERVKAGQKVSRENGILYGNGNILGYNHVKGDKSCESTYVIDKRQAETVRLIFDMYVNQGIGMRRIMRELCRLQREDAYDKVAWSTSKINRILRNSTYKGVICYNQSKVKNFLNHDRVMNFDKSTYIYKKGNFEPIIDEETWDRAQEIRGSRTQVVNEKGLNKLQGQKKAEDIWLRKLKCTCGSSYRKNRWRTNKSTGEIACGYQCYNQINNGSKSFKEKIGMNTEGSCDIKMIADWKLDMMSSIIIRSIWENKKETVEDAYNLIANCYIEETNSMRRNRKEIDNDINKLYDKKERLIEMRLEGELSKEDYIRMLEKLEKQVRALEYEKEMYAEQPEENVESKMKSIKRALNECVDFTKPKISEGLLNKFISQIIPLGDDKFKWVLNLGAGNQGIIRCGVQGRKGKANFVDSEGNGVHLYQDRTGSVERKTVNKV